MGQYFSVGITNVFVGGGGGDGGGSVEETPVFVSEGAETVNDPVLLVGGGGVGVINVNDVNDPKNTANVNFQTVFKNAAKKADLADEMLREAEKNLQEAAEKAALANEARREAEENLREAIKIEYDEKPPAKMHWKKYLETEKDRDGNSFSYITDAYHAKKYDKEQAEKKLHDIVSTPVAKAVLIAAGLEVGTNAGLEVDETTTNALILSLNHKLSMMVLNAVLNLEAANIAFLLVKTCHRDSERELAAFILSI